MSTVRLTIDGKKVDVKSSATLLDAARQAGAYIPVLCHMDGYDHFTSCMICLVEDRRSGRMLPACSAPAEEGMDIITDSPEIAASRKDTLELLLSEHAGDCEAPCQRGCPAHMDIPLMLRQIAARRYDEAVVTILRDIALPAVLGRICPAPCENACRRKSVDHPVAICLLKRFAADVNLSGSQAYSPVKRKATGKNVAVIGAGPAGLSAAWYLAMAGHGCAIYDRHSQPGGMLRYGIEDKDLDKSVLDAEIARILKAGPEFHPSMTLGKELPLEALHSRYDAVILATGAVEEGEALPGIDYTKRGIAVDKTSYATSVPGVFAGGNAIGRSNMAIRAAAHGKAMAERVDRMLSGEATVIRERFNSTLGKLRPEEHEEMLKGAAHYGRVQPAGGDRSGFNEEEAVREASRCMHCDCRKKETCELRKLSDRAGAKQKRFRIGERRPVSRILSDALIFEPGKCIKCGRCVRIAAGAGEPLGLTFSGRGFETILEVPFNEPLGEALTQNAGAYVDNCPTGAIAWKESDEEKDH